jgi:hypothetical protein
MDIEGVNSVGARKIYPFNHIIISRDLLIHYMAIALLFSSEVHRKICSNYGKLQKYRKTKKKCRTFFVIEFLILLSDFELLNENLKMHIKFREKLKIILIWRKNCRTLIFLLHIKFNRTNVLL